MKVCIHRGARQIGGSCVEIEHENARLILDLGLPLDAEDDVGLLPSVSYDGLRAVLISHPHQDHYGLLHHLPQEVPVAMGAAARRIIRAAAPFTRQKIVALTGPDLEHRKSVDFWPFLVTPFLVDHSAYDAYALLVEAGGKRLLYSGDIRAHGRKSGITENLLSHPPKDIDALLLEGSSLSRLPDDADFPSEEDLENLLMNSMRATEGLVMVYTSGQNLDRLVSVYRASRKCGRTLVIDLYAATVLEATGNEKLPQSHWEGVALCVPQAQRVQVKNEGWFELLKRHSKNRIYPGAIARNPSKFTLLFRPLWMRDLDRVGALTNACLVYSLWEGYLKTGKFQSVEAWLAMHQIPLHRIHTSGHASPKDLKRFATAVAPKVLVPIHSFAPERYKSLYSNVVIHGDGEWWEV